MMFIVMTLSCIYIDVDHDISIVMCRRHCDVVMSFVTIHPLRHCCRHLWSFLTAFIGTFCVKIGLLQCSTEQSATDYCCTITTSSELNDLQAEQS